MTLAIDPIRAADLTSLAEEWLAARHPNAVIVRELSVADWRGASLDIAAITDTRIVGVEVKGEGDSTTRLDRQWLSYGMVVREMWLLPCPSLADKCRKAKPQGWGMLEVWDGAVRPLNRATKLGQPQKRPDGGTFYPNTRDDERYTPDEARGRGHLCPRVICGTLWRDELHAIAGRLLLQPGKRTPVHVLTDILEEKVPAPLLHDEMIQQLRVRRWGAKHVRDLRTEDQHAAKAA